VTLFIASPLLAPLAMLGWGASLGAIVGAVIGSESNEKKDGKFAELVQDAIMNGQVVLVVQTRSEHETAIAERVIKQSVGDFEEATRVETPF
jgi:outer membrane lipoprotein SlyB